MMTSPISRLLLPLWTVAALFALPASAQVNPEPEEDDDKDNFVVLGVASLPEFEGGSDHQLVPFGVTNLNFKGMQLEIYGLQGTLNVLGNKGALKIGPAFSVNFPREDVIPDLPTFGEVDFALEVGGFVGFEVPFGRFREGSLRGQVSFRHDVLGAHSGFLVTPEIEYFFALNRMFRVGIGANATWASKDYMTSYFGVTPEQSQQSALDTFEIGAGLKDIGAEAFSIFSFSEQWGLFTRVSYNRILGDAADSPIIRTYGDRDQFFYGAGVFFRF